MAFDGLLPIQDRPLPPRFVEVAPNRFGRALVLDGDVKVRDRLALMFGYSSFGALLGIGVATVAGAVLPALVPAVALASIVGAILIARRGLSRLHWSARALVIVMHVTAMASVAIMYVPGAGEQILPLAGAFAGVLTILAVFYGRWFTSALNFALQALLLSAPFGAAFIASVFSHAAL